MKLSVIVPVYNAEAYLRDCVGSLLVQAVEDYEIILVNDGSTDGSAELMAEYARACPDVIRCLHLDNGGQGRARNHGLEIARGDFLGFVDSDDWVLPEMYQKLIHAAESQGADVAVCEIRQLHADGSFARMSTWREGCPMASAGSACNKLFRRETVEGLRFPEGLWYEDFAYSAMALMRSRKTVELPEMLYLYRCGQPSTMHNNNARKNLDILPIMEGLRAFMEREGCSRDDFEFLVVNHVLLDAISRLAQQDAPERKAVIQELRDYVHREIPELAACPSYRRESLKRRTVMSLNYRGMEDAAQLMLKAGRTLRGQ